MQAISRPLFQGQLMAFSLPKRRLQQLVSVFEFERGVAVHGIRTRAMQAGGIIVYLHLVKHVDVGFAGQLRGGYIAEWLLLVVALLIAVYLYPARNAAESQ